MKRLRLPGTLFFLGILLLCSFEALACRYNVRETGFVDLGLGQYRLFCFLGPDANDEETARLEPIAAATFANIPVSFEIVSLDRVSDHPALKFHQPSSTAAPSISLVSPDDEVLFLGPLWEGEFSETRVKERLAEVAVSPVRSRIAEELSASFGVVLLIEGENREENERVENIARQAISAVEAELEYFPKPIQNGPTLITLARDELVADPVLKWSFHLQSAALEEPALAVLYGRGRWIGPLMIGRQIRLELLSQVLFVIGADCECGLDPRLIRGTGIPIPWSREMRDRVSQELGFDPDNPLVRIEVGQILRTHSWQDMRSLTSEDPVLNFRIPSTGGRPKASGLRTTMVAVVIGVAVFVLFTGGFMLIRSRRGQH